MKKCLTAFTVTTKISLHITFVQADQSILCSHPHEPEGIYEAKFNSVDSDSGSSCLKPPSLNQVVSQGSVKSSSTCKIKESTCNSF